MPFLSRPDHGRRHRPEHPRSFQWIGHFHTVGNPGRHAIDESQELNYRFIMQAIAELGYAGFVSHEYSPAQGHDPIETLEKAMEICDV